jgi:hypothetical protein
MQIWNRKDRQFKGKEVQDQVFNRQNERDSKIAMRCVLETLMEMQGNMRISGL